MKKSYFIGQIACIGYPVLAQYLVGECRESSDSDDCLYGAVIFAETLSTGPDGKQISNMQVSENPFFPLNREARHYIGNENFIQYRLTDDETDVAVQLREKAFATKAGLHLAK